ncbi:spermatogenesis-associated protein 5-like protein 1 isoform X2 [Aplysia californica]|uniref:Spermatogenesis-associated protein 5-like protein 1 isoform X2 n=1 Tax=Aplysia californica TaxID=6500 RepID=A0ABM1VWA5_APLCA|nr:spermatogenesis-associated protein 5-like protein 1 isoform X2 [Aplysia californica]
MSADHNLSIFYQEVFGNNLKKVRNATLSVVVDNLNRFKSCGSQDKRYECIAKFCQNVLLNKILQSEQEIHLERSKLARSYGIVYIVVCACISENDSNEGVLTRDADVVVQSVISKDFYELRKSLHQEKVSVAGISTEAEKLNQLLRFGKLQYGTSYRQVGVLLHGPPGCGKSSLVKHIAQSCDAVVLNVESTDVLQSEVGSGVEALKRFFRRAVALSEEGSVILFLDELDTLCPHRDNSSLGSKQITSALIHELDSLHGKDIPGLLVLGATNVISSLDPSLRRPGRFDREVLINIPTKDQRLAILELFTNHVELDCAVQLCDIAMRTPGYVGADLRALCEEAESMTLKREGAVPPTVKLEDFDHALHCVAPLMKRSSDCVIDLQPVNWEDIGGLEDVKHEIRQSIEWPLLYPDVLHRMDLTPTKGVLLFGPPGCCKTTLVKAAATSCHVTFLSLSGAQVFSPYVGESEKIVSEAFQKARALSPSILFFDEIETLVGKRSSEKNQSRVQERILATLLNEMDGVGIRLDKKTNASLNQDRGRSTVGVSGPQEMQKMDNRGVGCTSIVSECNSSLDLKGSQVMVIGATNRPDMLDPAILRPGRLDKHIHVPPPDAEARAAILKVYTSKMSTSDLDLHKMSLDTELYTGADLKNLCKEAGLFALREILARGDPGSPICVNSHHFARAKEIVKPSL